MIVNTVIMMETPWRNPCSYFSDANWAMTAKTLDAIRSLTSLSESYFPIRDKRDFCCFYGKVFEPNFSTRSYTASLKFSSMSLMPDLRLLAYPVCKALSRPSFPLNFSRNKYVEYVIFYGMLPLNNPTFRSK